MRYLPILRFIIGIITVSLAAPYATAQTIATFNFKDPSQVNHWKGAHDISGVEACPDGMKIFISDNDPYLYGPRIDLPNGKALWATVQIYSETGGIGQLFYFQSNITEEKSVRFPVRKGRWETIQVALPPLSASTQFRLDPPGTSGICTVSSISFAIRNVLPTAILTKPSHFSPKSNRFALANGPLKLTLGNKLGQMSLNTGATEFAVGHNRPQMAILNAGQPVWIEITNADTAITKRNHSLTIQSKWRDPIGAIWSYVQKFDTTNKSSGIECSASLSCNQNRELLYFPVVMLLPGFGSFGNQRNQGLFGGLEYLDSPDSSSSEADIIGPGSHRQIPDMIRVTVPIMVIQNNRNYLALAWKPSDLVAPVYDSPNRMFEVEGHLMGLIFPGSNGFNREEGSLLPYQGFKLKANRAATAEWTIFGGAAENVIPALQAYTTTKGLPKVPIANRINEAQKYYNTAAAGYLNSHIAKQGLFQHAWPGQFGFGSAADAAVYMKWLSTQIQGNDAATKTTLLASSAEAISHVPITSRWTSSIGHVRHPLAPLVFGEVEANMHAAQQNALRLLGSLESPGGTEYRWNGSGPDYGKTHFAKDANGRTAQRIAEVLESSAFSGDSTLIHRAIVALHSLDKFYGSVPRGAQTWEVPLHTPDILASAYLVKAYLLGYELTHEASFLKHASYWAWSGVPFVTLWNPTGQEIGPYATTAVLGATQWVAPNWMGQPVQWCGLVYADSLYRLAKFDSSSPWRKIADGISASGVQQIWPIGSDKDRQGLLPDSVLLKAQLRNDAAINPGTLLPNAAQLFIHKPLYDYLFVPHNHLRIFAAGQIKLISQTDKTLAVSVTPWSPDESYVLINGISREAKTVTSPTTAKITENLELGARVIAIYGQTQIAIRLD